MSPFREAPDRTRATPAASRDEHDAVDQMVRQFADEMAFLRELVQNGIDAGATALTLTLSWRSGGDGDARGTLLVTLDDDGRGMTRDVIEHQLLVLFRSTKRGDDTKIGRFGVGFFSVFAPDPDEVFVVTGTDPHAEALRLRLARDYSWVLDTAAPRRGTAVTLSLPRSLADAQRFADASMRALERWCPHVSVTLTVETVGLGDDRRARIDTPFTLPGAVSLTHTAGPMRLALAAAERASAAYYNRGLLLHERAQSGAAADAPLVPFVRFKVDAPTLRHTLSRDALVDDESSARAHALVAELAAGPLAAALSAAIAPMARACAASRSTDAAHPDAATLLWMLCAAPRAPFRCAPASLVWPLVAAVKLDGEVRAAASFEASRWYARTQVAYSSARTAVAKALAARQVPVVDAGFAGVDGAARVVEALHAIWGEGAYDVNARWAFARSDGDHAALCEAVRARLFGAPLATVCAGRIEGAAASRLWVAVDAAGVDEGALFKPDDAKMERGRALVFNTAHARWTLCADAASHDLALAATVLAREVLREGRFDEAAETAWFARVAAECGA